MKIIGQSTIVSTPPYVHLGYLATTIVEYSKVPIGAGLGLVALGVLLAFRLKRIGAGWWRGTHLVLRRPIGLSILGFCTIGMGYFGMSYRTSFDTGIYTAPEWVTKGRLAALHTHIVWRVSEGIPWAEAIREANQSDPKQNYDAWGVKLKIEPVALDGSDNIRVISAGPDELFDTPDDLIYSGQG